jgi:hypothetical protein
VRIQDSQVLEEYRYKIFSQLIERRNTLVFNKLRPVIERLAIIAMRPSDIPRIEHELGPDISSDLKSTTDNIVTFADENVSSLEELYPRLRTAFKSIYPDEEFIKIEFS